MHTVAVSTTYCVHGQLLQIHLLILLIIVLIVLCEYNDFTRLCIYQCLNFQSALACLSVLILL